MSELMPLSELQSTEQILSEALEEFRKNLDKCVIAKLAGVSEWQPIETAPNEVWPNSEVDLWLQVHASPRSFGWADYFRVTDCYRELTEDGHTGKWVHRHDGKEVELYQPYITHWMPLPEPPK